MSPLRGFFDIFCLKVQRTSPFAILFRHFVDWLLIYLFFYFKPFTRLELYFALISDAPWFGLKATVAFKVLCLSLRYLMRKIKTQSKTRILLP